MSGRPSDRTAGPPPTRSFDPRRGLVGLAAFGVGGVGLSVCYTATGIGLPCPFRLVTGLECPLCGGTRLGAALLRADVAGAFAANPLVLIGLAVLAVLGAAWVTEVAGGPRLRPPTRIRQTAERLGSTRWVLVAVGVALVYAVLRNLFLPH